MHRFVPFALACALLTLPACAAPGALDGLVVALPPSTPDNVSVIPIVIVAPRAQGVQYRYAWTTTAAGVDSWTLEQESIGDWQTRPGETWTVSITPYIGLSEGPAAEATTLITDAGRDTDNDGDGWTETQGDCDDTDPSNTPFQDRDNDGFSPCPGPFGGEVDCDDTDRNVNPGMNRDDDDKLLEDDDCDGILDEDAVEVGDLMIVEVHAQPSVAGAGWIELVSTASGPRDLLRWTLSGVSLPSARVLPLARVVLCPNPEAAEDAGVDCLNAVGFSESVFEDALVLEVEQRSEFVLGVHELALEGLPLAEGVAAQLDAAFALAPALSTEADDWCAATEDFGGGDLGTPGAPNRVCGE